LGFNANPDALLTVWPNDGETLEWPTKMAIGPQTVWEWVNALNGGQPPVVQ
jgi:hypothetical protein